MRPTYEQVARFARPFGQLVTILCFAGTAFTVFGDAFLARQTLLHRLVFTMWWFPPMLANLILSFVMTAWAKARFIVAMEIYERELRANGYARHADELARSIAALRRRPWRRVKIVWTREP